MRSMEPWLPPCDLNQSVKEILSRARTSRMPPSGSTSALTTGDVPRAREFWTCNSAPTRECNHPADDSRGATNHYLEGRMEEPTILHLLHQ